MEYGIIYIKEGQRVFTFAGDHVVNTIKLRLQERGLEIRETVPFENDADRKSFLDREMKLLKESKPADNDSN